MPKRAASPSSPSSRPLPSSVSIRKRRSASSLASRLQEAQHDENENDAGLPTVSSHENTSRIKRVRFSKSATDTGLTPHIRRTTLSPTLLGRTRHSTPPRRSSVPPNLSYFPNCNVQYLHISPLKQVLTERTKRQLRRSHLSEEMNEWEAEMKASKRAQRDLHKLQQEYQATEGRARDLEWQLETQRQFGIEINDDEARKTQEYQDEITRLRAQIGIDRVTPTTSIKEPMESVEDDIGASSLPIDTPWEDETFFSSPHHAASYDEETPTHDTRKDVLASTHAETQADLPNETHLARIKSMEDAIARKDREADDAQIALKIISHALADLGFTAESNENCEELIGNARECFRECRLGLERLLPGETPASLTDCPALLSSMLRHIEKLAETERKQAHSLSSHQQSESALRGQFNNTLQRLANAEQHLKIVKAHRTELLATLSQKEEALEALTKAFDETMETKDKAIAELEKEDATKTTSTQKLISALDKYREEVKALEALVTDQEDQNNDNVDHLNRLKSENEKLSADNTKLRDELLRTRDKFSEHVFTENSIFSSTMHHYTKKRDESLKFLRESESPPLDPRPGLLSKPARRPSQKGSVAEGKSAEKNVDFDTSSKRDSGVFMDVEE